MQNQLYFLCIGMKRMFVKLDLAGFRTYVTQTLGMSFDDFIGGRGITNNTPDAAIYISERLFIKYKDSSYFTRLFGPCYFSLTPAQTISLLNVCGYPDMDAEENWIKTNVLRPEFTQPTDDIWQKRPNLCKNQ